MTSIIVSNEIRHGTTEKILSDVISLQQFLESWDDEYEKSLINIDIFNKNLTHNWTLAQKKIFVCYLYHLRGHFDDFLWYMGNFAPDQKTKQMILNNIRDEFGNHGLSHEQLYLLFAKSMGVDLTYELVEENFNAPFIKKYINEQLIWLREHDWEHRLSWFAAIERLDNVDYVNLRNIATSIGATDKNLVFFNVHINADHFENILITALNKLWRKNPLIVKQVFNFVLNYQTKMWKNLSDAIFNHNK